MRTACYFLLYLMATLVCACTTTPDPCAVAIEKELTKNLDGKYVFRMHSMTKVDSSTFRDEFRRRSEIFRTKEKADFKLYNDYFERGLRQNVARKLADMDSDRAIVDSLELMLGQMGASADTVAFYDILFTAEVRAGGSSQMISDCYAAVTPSGEVLCITEDRRDLHKTTGRVIPGYSELIGSKQTE